MLVARLEQGRQIEAAEAVAEAVAREPPETRVTPTPRHRSCSPQEGQEGQEGLPALPLLAATALRALLGLLARMEPVVVAVVAAAVVAPALLAVAQAEQAATEPLEATVSLSFPGNYLEKERLR